jgi:hypothetical protein
MASAATTAKAAPSTAASARVPQMDISSFLDYAAGSVDGAAAAAGGEPAPMPPAAQKVVSMWREAMTDVGLVIIRGHGVDGAVFEGLHAASAEFFALSTGRHFTPPPRARRRRLCYRLPRSRLH